MCIIIVCFLGCEVINFEIDLIFLMKSFLHMTKKSKHKFKYFENEKSFFHKGLSVAKFKVNNKDTRAMPCQ